MKALLTILFIYAGNCIGQTPCASLANRLDTVAHPYIVADKTRVYNYYNKNGSLAWGSVKEYNVSLIPAGGTFTITIPGNKLTLKNGYRVWATDSACVMKVIGYLDDKKKPLVRTKPEFYATIVF